MLVAFLETRDGSLEELSALPIPRHIPASSQIVTLNTAIAVWVFTDYVRNITVRRSL